MNEKLEEFVLDFIEKKEKHCNENYCTNEELYSAIKKDCPSLMDGDITYILGEMLKKGLIRWTNVEGVDYYRLPLKKPVSLPNNKKLNY